MKPAPPLAPLRRWHGYYELPEHRSAWLAARRFCRAVVKGSPPSVDRLLLHGLPGTGKSTLMAAMMAELMLSPRGLSVPRVAAIDLSPADGSADGSADGFPAGTTSGTALGEEETLWLNADVLFIEDLQRLPRKRSAGLCRLLDHRVQRRRPTVMTATGGPAQLTRLTRRLTSRLAAGLVLALPPISRITRRRLLPHFAADAGLTLEDDALDDLLKRSRGNAGLRTIQGLVTQLKIHLSGKAVTITAKSLKDLLSEIDSLSTISPLEQILGQTATRLNVSVYDLLSPSRRKELVLARQVAMYLARELTGTSWPQLGQFFGGRDHTTVMHAHRKIAEQAKIDRSLAKLLRDLRAELE